MFDARATTRKIVLEILKKSQKIVIFAYFCEKKQTVSILGSSLIRNLGRYFEPIFCVLSSSHPKFVLKREK